jgi:hypothetical protein
MKRISTIIALGAITIFMSNATFAMQGRSQGGRPTGTGAPSNPGAGAPSHPGAGAPSNPGSFPATRPATSIPPTTASKSGLDHREENRGTPAATGKSAEHKSDSAGPKDDMGFKNYGQYVAAQHVSENLNIPFADLKSAMVDGHKSLGDAIHQFRPDLNQQQVQVEIKKAEAAAKKASAEAKKKS